MFYICRGTYLLFQTLSGFLSKGFNDKSVERCKGKKIEKDLYTFEDKIDMRKNGVHISFTGSKGQEVSDNRTGRDISKETRRRFLFIPG